MKVPKSVYRVDSATAVLLPGCREPCPDYSCNPLRQRRALKPVTRGYKLSTFQCILDLAMDAALPQPHVLALDDDPSIRGLLSEYLSQNEMRVTAVENGYVFHADVRVVQ